MRIEGFRSLNEVITTIINKSEAVKKAKKESEKLTPKEKKKLTVSDLLAQFERVSGEEFASDKALLS